MKKVIDIAKKINQEGGRALVVGGFVRDKLLGIESKDIDIEVYGVALEKLKEVLERLGEVDLVGESFAVFKLGEIDPAGEHSSWVDVSIPRRDNKVGRGHKGFEVEADPDMSFADASRRRDFTINAMAWDPLTEEILDEHGGQEDLKNKVLRAVDKKTFADDPLRVLRAAQLAARFGLIIEDETKKLCQNIDLTELSRERIGEEWKKMLLKSKKPSIGLELARELGVIEKLYPELEALIETPQEPEWHPEGDVWEHTKLAVDKGAEIADREGLEEEEREILILSCLCHDLGKPTATKKEGKRIRSKGHDHAGLVPTLAFLKKLAISKAVVEKVLPLVKEHQFFRLPEFSDRAIRRLSVRLKPATIQELVWVMEADLSARGEKSRELHEGEDILKKAKALKVLDNTPEPLVTGEDLKKLGFKQGKKLGKMLEQLFEAQLDGQFATKAQGLEYLNQQR